jgi:HD-GYP domain-containing protein (c-di-GMP phosphodiesterase class II)
LAGPADVGGVLNVAMFRSRPVVAVAAAGPMVAFATLRLAGQGNGPAVGGADVHVLCVAAAAAAAIVTSVLTSVAAVRHGDARAGLVGVAFTVMAGLLLVHGLATPGVILSVSEPNAVVGVAGILAVPLAGVVLAFALLWGHRGDARRTVVVSQTAAVGLLAAFAIAGLAHPALIPQIPLTVDPWTWTIAAATVALFSWVSWNAITTFQLTHRLSDLCVALGLGWIGSAIVLYLGAPVWSSVFWISHALELCGLVLVTGATMIDLARQAPSLSLQATPLGPRLVRSDGELLGGFVRTLTATLADRDPSTGAHSHRVAELAVRAGAAARLSPTAMRRLAIAGLLHDIGKLTVPADILNKPGRLTDEEFATVKTHPAAGASILLHLGGLEREAAIVRAHHERYDGAGYPDGISGEAIPLEARLLAVCDVFDALTSDRAYRSAWPAERARELLRAESGTAFDPRCVEALVCALDEGAQPQIAVLPARAGRLAGVRLAG